MVMRNTTTRHLCVLSDATGATAAHVVRATLTQFGNANVTLEAFPKIATSAELQRAVAEAKRRRALIAYTVVDRRLRTEIALLANEEGVPAVDLLGPLLSALGEFLSVTPTFQAGLYKAPDEKDVDRSEAATFTVHHDDGQGVHDLDNADVVLVGPSRTSKTPLSVYLAYAHGLKVANVPLALGVKPFEELERFDGRRVIALTISVPRLVRIRRERQRHLGTDDIAYADPADVQRELRYCHELYRQHAAWSVVDVTDRSIEEIAGEICARIVSRVAPKAPHLGEPPGS
jgi:regulator of PEP synthase PpsR (kinase-PPPase family)